MALVDFNDEFSISVYFKYCRLVDCGIWRQPWLVYGLMKTADGTSQNVSAGNALFTLIGFGGMYFYSA